MRRKGEFYFSPNKKYKQLLINALKFTCQLMMQLLAGRSNFIPL